MTTAYLGYALAQAALAVWAFRLWRRDREITSLLLAIPIATVWYDNVIVGIGSWIGAGPLLEALTFPRFLGHALFTPSWIVASVALALRAGAFKGRERLATVTAWVLYVAMIVIGFVNEVVCFTGELVREGDVIYYTNVGRLITPPPPSLVMMLVVLVCGLLVWRHARWPWMFLGGLPVLLSRAIPTDSVSFALVNSGEVIASAALVATLAYLQKREDAARA